MLSRPVAARTLAAMLVGALPLAAGCAARQSSSGPPVVVSTPSSHAQYKGDPLDPPVSMPSVTLTDTAGRPYNLRQRTAGKVTVLYFGYTHCPDVCPTTMADVAQALHMLPAAQQRRVDVVFVTTDPWRDTPARLRSWLDHFDPSFVGLTGPFPAIQQAAKAVGVMIQAPAKRTGDYEVDHGAQTLIFSPDDRARLLFTADSPAADIAHDLSKLTARGA